MLAKMSVIEQILTINRSASREWLRHFRKSSLLRYLENLERTLEPRGGQSVNVRSGETPAVVWRRAR